MRPIETAHFRAPSRALLWSEQLRAVAETTAYLVSLPMLAVGARGDGHHVLVLPGLLADDRSTAILRHVLCLRGYRPHSWDLGTNIGPTPRITEGLLDRLQTLYETDGQPVTVIGWSLGGLFARALARLRPDTVRSVITLGTPIRLTVHSHVEASHASRIYHAFRPWHSDHLETAESPHQRHSSSVVPATSIYSKLDGVVPWQACLDLEGPHRENIEVPCSHLGFGVHPVVLAIVLNRLAQPADGWRKYGAQDLAGSARG